MLVEEVLVLDDHGRICIIADPWLFLVPLVAMFVGAEGCSHRGRELGDFTAIKKTSSLFDHRSFRRNWQI